MASVVFPIALLVAAANAPLVLVLLAHHSAAAPLLAAQVNVALEGCLSAAAFHVADALTALYVLRDLELLLFYFHFY